MMKFNFKSVIASIFLLLTSPMLFAFDDTGGDPPPPEGIGGQAKTVPVDMYWFVLAAVAILFILINTKKYIKFSEK